MEHLNINQRLLIFLLCCPAFKNEELDTLLRLAEKELTGLQQNTSLSEEIAQKSKNAASYMHEAGEPKSGEWFLILAENKGAMFCYYYCAVIIIIINTFTAKNTKIKYIKQHILVPKKWHCITRTFFYS